MATSFELLVTHLRLGLSHIKLAVRTFALETTLILFEAQPKLCSQTQALYEGFLTVMKEPTKRPSKRALLVDAVQKFRLVYDRSHDDDAQQTPTDFRTFNTLVWLTNRTKSTMRHEGAPVKAIDTSWLDSLL